MKRPWFRQARQLANDLRYMDLSVEGLAAYLSAYQYADDDGVLSCGAGRDGVGVLAEQFSLRRRDADPTWAIDVPPGVHVLGDSWPEWHDLLHDLARSPRQAAWDYPAWEATQPHSLHRYLSRWMHEG